MSDKTHASTTGSALDREAERVETMTSPKPEPSKPSADDALAHVEKVLQVEQDATIRKTKSDLAGSGKGNKGEKNLNPDG